MARRVLLLILLLAGVYALPRVVALHGISRTFQFRNGDQVHHLINLVLRTRAWKPGVPRDSALLKHEPGGFRPSFQTRWPPGVYMVASPLAAIFGPTSIWTTQLTNLFFLAILSLGVILLGKPLVGLRGGGWAAALTLLTPPVVASSWYFNLDLGLAAMAVMGLHLLRSTRGFSAWAPTIGFAGWSVLGVLVKGTYPLYLALPCLVSLVLGLRLPGQRRQRALRAAVGAAASLALALTLLPGDFGSLWQEFTQHTTGMGRHDTGDGRLIQSLTLEWFLSVPLMAIRGYPWPLLLPLLPMVFMVHHPRARIADRPLLLAFCWGTVVMLTLLTHRMERYLLPLYPLLSLLAVWGIQQLFSRWQRWILSALVILHLATLWVVHNNPTPWFLDPALENRRSWMHDQRMPSIDEMRHLRRLRQSAMMDYRFLEASMKRALAASRRRGPVGVTIMLKPRQVRAPAGFKADIFLLAAQLERSRLLPFTLLDDSEQGLEHALYRQCPTLLVVHDPSVEAKIPGDPRKVVAQEDVQVKGEEDVFPLRVTLLERQ